MKRKHLNLAAVQAALSENEDGVDSMKREVITFQQGELASAQAELVNLRKQHDKLCQDADAKEATHKSVCEELGALERQAGVGGRNNPCGTGGDPVLHVAALQDAIDETEKKLRASTEQKMVFGHMVGRLKGELLVMLKDYNLTRSKVSGQAIELANGTMQHEAAKHDLKVEEDNLADLMKRLEEKRKQHQTRIDGIKKIIEDRSELLERQEERLKKKEEIMTKADLGVDEEQKLKRMNVIRQLYTTILEKKMTDDEEHLSSLEDTFHRLKNVTGLSNVEEVVDKFQSRSEKNVQLQAVADDLKKRIDALKAENIRQEDELVLLIARTEANAGNRQVYREVDEIDLTTAGVLKQCEDSKGRATRLSVVIGELREAISRFMSKLYDKLVPVPSVKELPEKLHDLDTQLSDKMKIVTAYISKKEDSDKEGGSSPDKNAGDGGDQTSFSRMVGGQLGKIMFHKLMTTDPDQTPRNVRVSTFLTQEELMKYNQRMLLDPNFEKSIPPTSAKGLEQRIAHEPDVDDPDAKVIDRDMIKKLTKLVLTKDDQLKKKEQKKKKEALDAALEDFD